MASAEVVTEQAGVAEELTPMQIGAEWLIERGVSLEVAGIQLAGPLPECRGTLAEMVAVVGHSAIKASVEGAIDAALQSGEDPSEEILKRIEFFAVRDDEGRIMRADPEVLKKK